MKDEINQVKGARIYCIYFQNIEYSSNSSEDPLITLKKISDLGGTGIYKTSNSLTSLVKAFYDISKAIEINFKLSFSKKNN